MMLMDYVPEDMQLLPHGNFCEYAYQIMGETKINTIQRSIKYGTPSGRPFPSVGLGLSLAEILASGTLRAKICIDAIVPNNPLY